MINYQLYFRLELKTHCTNSEYFYFNLLSELELFVLSKKEEFLIRFGAINVVPFISGVECQVGDKCRVMGEGNKIFTITGLRINRKLHDYSFLLDDSFYECPYKCFKV